MRKLLWLFLFFTPAVQAQQANWADYIKPSQETPVPLVEFEDANGKTHSLDEFRGKVVLVNFWAIWCQPCTYEMPSLDRLQKKFGGRGLQVIPLSNDYANFQTASDFYKKENITALPIYMDKGAHAFRVFRLRSLPVTILIDRRGTEVARASGYVEWDDPAVEKYIEGLLKAN